MYVVDEVTRDLSSREFVLRKENTVNLWMIRTRAHTHHRTRTCIFLLIAFTEIRFPLLLDRMIFGPVIDSLTTAIQNKVLFQSNGYVRFLTQNMPTNYVR